VLFAVKIGFNYTLLMLRTITQTEQIPTTS
jgi:hypothetical protein